ncbi:MAG: flavodoxin family protein [Treponema sp.]|nr:flavodoxin family protein [Treponema sp.]
MKILILNGSPRKNGKTAQLLHCAEQVIIQSGNSAIYTDVCSLRFTHCTGCMACRSHIHCVLPHDDAHTIADEIQTCDGIIVGTPVYWGNINGTLKCLFDRLVGVMMGESKWGIPIPLHKGKRALIITSCTTPFPFNILAGQTTKAEKAIKEILSYSGFTVCRTVALAGTKNMPAIPEHTYTKVQKAAKLLVR